jgi:hypothetical protein
MITRNNYEEFFLLYVDNELSPADREAVEGFVEENPDLKEELELLLQCKIGPDELPSFSGKDRLFRFESPDYRGVDTPLIHTGNYETWFLSYIDDELDTPSRQVVIDFIRRYPEKNIELQQLQRTVNTPDPDIKFPNKASLYRKESAPARKIAWLPFARIAAAALILGAVGLLVFRKFTPAHPDSNNAPTIARSGSQQSRTNAHPDSNNAATIAQPGARQSTNPDPVLAGTTPSTEKKSLAPVTRRAVDPYYIQKKGDKRSTPTVGEPTAPSLAQVDPARSTQADPARSSQTDPARSSQTDPVRPAKTVDTDPGRVMAVVVPKSIDNNAKIPATLTVAAYQSQLDASSNMNASFASRALTDRDDDSQDETGSPRKNKLRGIFRKVTRVLEKSSTREEDDNKKVTIGGFQFALK